MSVYESGRTRLCYRATGAELPVVFLHPTPLDHVYWRPLTDNLAGVRAIVPDLRGHGCSQVGDALEVGGFPAVPYALVLGIGQLAKDVLTLLDHLQIPEAVLVGSSIGGYVALEIWRQAPERVRGLAFVCSKPQPDTETNQLRRATTIDRIRAGEIEEIFDEMAQSLIGPTARERRPEIVAELRARMTLTPETLIAVQAGLATRPDSRTTIRTITVPVLAVAGGEDPGVTPEEMQAFSYAPGGFEFHLLPDAGHMAAYEQPEKVASLLAEWLRQMDV